MSVGIFRGKHSFSAIINQADRKVTALNPFDRQAAALLKTPGLKSVILTTHAAYLEAYPQSLLNFTFSWKITVEYKYFGLRTTVIVQPTPRSN